MLEMWDQPGLAWWMAHCPTLRTAVLALADVWLAGCCWALQQRRSLL